MFHQFGQAKCAYSNAILSLSKNDSAASKMELALKVVKIDPKIMEGAVNIEYGNIEDRKRGHGKREHRKLVES